MGMGIVAGINYSLMLQHGARPARGDVTAGNIMLPVLWQQHQNAWSCLLHPRPVSFFGCRDGAPAAAG